MSEALSVLGYHEIPEDERPPSHIWGNDEALIAWFDEVEFRRKNPDKDRMEDVEAPMQQNDLAARLRMGDR